MTAFAKRVLEVVKSIPKGETRTYLEVAKKAGSPGASRAVGNILNRYDSTVFKVPCHRVIRSDGKTGGYRWGAAKKARLLKEEGAL
jgi:O-6-methylguanine DNA methyltransferase